MRAIGLVLISAVLMVSPAPASDDWYPSRYGADDTLGAINELSPQGVLAAARLVKTGKTYALAVETGRDTPAFGTRSVQTLRSREWRRERLHDRCQRSQLQ